jgi:hypothetical protein
VRPLVWPPDLPVKCAADSPRLIRRSARIRDSLVEGVRYTATAVGAGFSNQLIGYIMLLQYARKADRVPILGDFVARSNDNILTKGPVAPYLLFVRRP